MASCGIANVPVYRPVKIAFFSTGDELKPLGSQLETGQIYDSNRYSLNALIEETGAEPIDMGVIPDKREAVEQALLSASKNADLIITTGGVSVGDADYITEIVRKIGRLDLWKIAMKPGKPLAFGSIGKCTFFGLPGNPVSVMVTFDQIVRPTLQHMMGVIDPKPILELQATALYPLKKAPGRMEFQRGILTTIDRQLFVQPTGIQGSHMMTSMSQANCYIVLEQDCCDIHKGDLVTVQIMKDAL
jgi:molybdopterin molybdotransferase